MKDCRCYGKEPYRVAVVHGGPGAPGSVAAIARELSVDRGVLEPIQTKTTVEDQVLELHNTILKYGEPPAILIGHSWGAWLAYITVAKYPELVKKLVLVGSGPFEAGYVKALGENRLNRMSPEDREEYESILELVNSEDVSNKDAKLARLGEIVEKADSYDVEEVPTEKLDMIPVEGDTFQQVWREAAELRRSGLLLEYGKQIKCPVIAIHGDYDPHPAKGVKEPLGRVIKDLRFFLLEKCGHSPWKEVFARDEFYSIIRSVIGTSI